MKVTQFTMLIRTAFFSIVLAKSLNFPLPGKKVVVAPQEKWGKVEYGTSLKKQITSKIDKTLWDSLNVT